MLYLNGTTLLPTMFPDNTSQIWDLDEELLLSTNFANVTWSFDNEGELLHLAQLKHLLDSYKFSVRLNLNYLPYGRQDKEVSNSKTFALRTFAKLLNSMHFSEITCLDPHSEVAAQIIDNFKPKYPISQVHGAYNSSTSDLVCYPDDGALKKYRDLYRLPFIHACKARNQKTGEIFEFALKGEASQKRVLIVDDICDGGKTFTILAEKLYESGATFVGLFVTHGLFTKGLKPLRDNGINRIFTAKGEMGYDARNFI